MFVSYAQNFEDVMLWRALKHIENGFYLDIGAQDPVTDSVSKGFYVRGWRGVHVEPTSTYAEKLRQDRPEETVLQYAVGEGVGRIRFFEFPETGLSTGDPDFALAHKADGFQCQETEVELISLDAILDRCEGRDIHWMKIDVEGMEASVLASWGNNPARPWIVVIESTTPLTKVRTDTEWQHLLQERGYELCYFDGLNCYFVSDSAANLKSFLATPPNIFDEFTLSDTPGLWMTTLLTNRLEDARRGLEAATQRSENLEQKLSELTAERLADAQRSASLDKKISELKAGRLADLEREVTVRAQMDALRQQQTDLFKAHSDSMKRELELTQALSDSRRQVDHLHAQIVSLHRSFSWRIMTPYRVLSKAASRGIWLLARLPRRLVGLLKRYLHNALRLGTKTVQGNPRLYTLARKLISRHASLRMLAMRVLRISRGQLLVRPQAPMILVNTIHPHAVNVSDEELTTLSRVGRIMLARSAFAKSG